MTTREHEQTLNVWLADRLKKRGLNARPEVTRPGNRRIDVEVRIGPAVIAVECEHGQSPAKRAEASGDADRRMEQGLAHGAVAVCYPEDTTEESLTGAKFIWAVRDGVNVAPNWNAGDLDRLASVIRLTPAQLGNPDYAAAALSNSLDAAAGRLNETQKRRLAQTLDLPASRKGRERWNTPAKCALLVLATAVMFHSRLDSHLPSMRPELDGRENPPAPFSGPWPTDMAHRCRDAHDPIAAFRDAWDLILALDYKPIFETGRAALQACPPDPAFADAVRDTADAALAVVQNIAGLRHDLLGRIFHNVLDTARYDGSFYTTTAAATLLATLALRDDTCDGNDPEAISRLRITDPACGTGTLLMAAAERIRDLAPQADVDGSISRALIENVFTGYDVNLTATHMAATTLGLLSPTTQFRNMKIGRTFLGVDDAGEAHLGSLEFLDRQPMLMPWPGGAQTAAQVDTGEGMAAAEPADLVIMNPPFTRDSLRHDQFDPAAERKIKDREKTLFADTPVHLSSNGNAFLALAEYISKRDTGTIAAVLPLVTATNASSLEIRRYLASHFHIETVVTSHDPERIYFSENTSIGEMLAICRRWPGDKGAKPPTRVVNLARNPATPADAISVAAAIQNGAVAIQGYGTELEWPADRIAAGDWGAVQFLSPYLCENSAKIFALRRKDFCPLIPLGKVADIGPDGRYVRGTFHRSSMPGAGGMSALWDHKTDVTQTMSASCDAHIIPKPGKGQTAQRLWRQRGTLLLPTRVRLNTVRTLSVRLETPVVGSAWVPCKPGSESSEKAICVYLNSSVGILAMLGNRSNRTPAYPQFSMDDMNKLVVPDFDVIGAAAMAELSAAYDAHAADILLPLPQMEADPVRRALDDAVCASPGLDVERVAAIRRSLAAEPSVTGKRYAGLRPA
jgi:hypothetical protein